MKIRPVHKCLTAAFCLVLLINAASPFIGLKWEFSFSMFSGLKTDGSNHFFFPSYHLFDNYEYWIVEKLELGEAEYDEHTAIFCELLTRSGQPAMTSALSDQEQSPTRPIHGNIIRYHLSRFQDRGVDVNLSLASFGGQEKVDLSARDAPPEWTSFSYHIQYPIVIHNYSLIHKIRKDYHERTREEE